MKLRVVLVLILMITAFSCKKLPFAKKKQIQQIDTIIDYGSVDAFPSFTNCDSIIDKKQQSNCFRKTLHDKIGKELLSHTFEVNDSINETILLFVLIDKNGIISLEKIESSSVIQQELPNLDSIIQVSIAKLPKIFPAIKRGIPVSSNYQIPIKIKLQ